MKPARQHQAQDSHSQPSSVLASATATRLLRVVRDVPQGTSRLACVRQVRNQAGGGQAGLRFVVPTSTGPMEFHKSTRDLKGQSI